MPFFKDQMHRLVEITNHPKKIISLVPSQTELLFTLGLEKQVVGITKFCVHPPGWIQEKKVIGGTKNFHPDRIRKLDPDLIIGNKEENYKEGIKLLEEEFPVWMSDIFTMEDALQMIRQVGNITGVRDEGEGIAGEIERLLKQFVPLPKPISCLYFIWRGPFMGVGGNTFIDDMLALCGFVNLLSAQDRYPELSIEKIQQLNPQLILLSSEPYPFKEQHLLEMQNLCPEAEVLLVDGEMFSWSGSHLLKALPYMQNLLDDLRLRFKI